MRQTCSYVSPYNSDGQPKLLHILIRQCCPSWTALGPFSGNPTPKRDWLGQVQGHVGPGEISRIPRKSSRNSRRPNRVAEVAGPRFFDAKVFCSLWFAFWKAFAELSKKVILLSENFHQKFTCFRRMFWKPAFRELSKSFQRNFWKPAFIVHTFFGGPKKCPKKCPRDTFW